MLDKNVLHKPIIMAMGPAAQQAVAAPVLPAGYSLRLYRPGDEAAWAETETAVLEFEDEAAALEYFGKEFLPWPERLAESMVFACDEAGTPVANASAWFHRDHPEVSILHWVAARPNLQGKGLGKAVVQQAIIIGRRQSPGREMFLQTQTWSHVAVRLYYSLGFQLVKNIPYPGMKNSYEEAMQVLKGVYPPDLWEEMAAGARTVEP